MVIGNLIEKLSEVEQDTFTKEEIFAFIAEARRRTPLPQLESNGVVVDPNSRKVTFKGKQLTFQPQLFNLLYYMIENKNTIISRNVIMRDVWKKGVKVRLRTIDVYLSLIRTALGESFIDVVNGYGYIWVEK